jgi:hypothetical protein
MTSAGDDGRAPAQPRSARPQAPKLFATTGQEPAWCQWCGWYLNRCCSPLGMLGHDQPRDSHVRGGPHPRAEPTAYRNEIPQHLARLAAALACSVTNMVAVAGSSGRRGRRFKSCHPDQCHRSLTCINAALRRTAFHSSPPADAPKEQKRNTRETQGKPGPTSTGSRTPGLPARRSRPRGTAGSPTAL